MTPPICSNVHKSAERSWICCPQGNPSSHTSACGTGKGSEDDQARRSMGLIPTYVIPQIAFNPEHLVVKIPRKEHASVGKCARGCGFTNKCVL